MAVEPQAALDSSRAREVGVACHDREPQAIVEPLCDANHVLYQTEEAPSDYAHGFKAVRLCVKPIWHRVEQGGSVDGKPLFPDQGLADRSQSRKDDRERSDVILLGLQGSAIACH